MRFRNYINSFSRRNRIYSDEDLLKMTLQALFDNEPSILAQYETIGIPDYIELEQSPNTQWIEPFKNEKGLDDGGYWQSVLTPEYQESFAPKQYNLNQKQNAIVNNEWDDVDTRDLDKYLDKNIIDIMPDNKKEEYEVNKNPNKALEGNLEKNVYPEQKTFEQDVSSRREKNTLDKYFGLEIVPALQKAASKTLPYNKVENEYYKNSLKMNDGEPLTDEFLKENDIYGLKDITDPEKSNYYKEQLAKMYGLDLNDPDIDEKLKDKKIVVPKENSRLYQYAKNSEAIEKWIVDNYDRIKNGEKPLKDSIEFPSSIKDDESRGLFATIHNADTNNAKINEDDSLTLELDDNYDFAKWDKHKWNNQDSIKTNLYKKGIVNINNNAYEQQENGQLENFPITMRLKYAKEELEELMRKYKYRR